MFENGGWGRGSSTTASLTAIVLYSSFKMKSGEMMQDATN
jgi:hypothetical protein